MYLFFDTETTGLPKDKKYGASYTETDIWPRLVQLAWTIYDPEGKPRASHDFIIAVDGFDIPKEASDIHGITGTTADIYGHKLAPVLQLFGRDVDRCGYVVGHNVDFDVKVIASEMVRLGSHDAAKMVYEFDRLDTMKESTNVVKLKGAYGKYKWPKLAELYKYLFDKDLEGAHNALVDIQATVDCFYKLKEMGHFKGAI